MPREYVNIPSEPAEHVPDSTVTVGWNKAAPWMQIAVSQFVDGQEVQAWTHPMTRAQANALIRLLRKARDDAHGRDA